MKVPAFQKQMLQDRLRNGLREIVTHSTQAETLAGEFGEELGIPATSQIFTTTVLQQMLRNRQTTQVGKIVQASTNSTVLDWAIETGQPKLLEAVGRNNRATIQHLGAVRNAYLENRRKTILIPLLEAAIRLALPFDISGISGEELHTALTTIYPGREVQGVQWRLLSDNPAVLTAVNNHLLDQLESYPNKKAAVKIQTYKLTYLDKRLLNVCEGEQLQKLTQLWVKDPQILPDTKMVLKILDNAADKKIWSQIVSRLYHPVQPQRPYRTGGTGKTGGWDVAIRQIIATKNGQKDGQTSLRKFSWLRAAGRQLAHDHGEVAERWSNTFEVLGRGQELGGAGLRNTEKFPVMEQVVALYGEFSDQALDEAGIGQGGYEKSVMLRRKILNEAGAGNNGRNIKRGWHLTRNNEEPYRGTTSFQTLTYVELAEQIQAVIYGKTHSTDDKTLGEMLIHAAEQNWLNSMLGKLQLYLILDYIGKRGTKEAAVTYGVWWAERANPHGYAILSSWLADAFTNDAGEWRTVLQLLPVVPQTVTIVELQSILNR